MIKGTIHEEDIMVINIYKAIINKPKVKIDGNKIIAGDFNTPLTSMDRSSRQKVNKETVALNETLDQMDVIDLHRTFHPNASEYTF